MNDTLTFENTLDDGDQSNPANYIAASTGLPPVSIDATDAIVFPTADGTVSGVLPSVVSISVNQNGGGRAYNFASGSWPAGAMISMTTGPAGGVVAFNGMTSGSTIAAVCDAGNPRSISFNADPGCAIVLTGCSVTVVLAGDITSNGNNDFPSTITWPGNVVLNVVDHVPITAASVFNGLVTLASGISVAVAAPSPFYCTFNGGLIATGVIDIAALSWNALTITDPTSITNLIGTGPVSLSGYTFGSPPNPDDVLTTAGGNYTAPATNAVDSTTTFGANNATRGGNISDVLATDQVKDGTSYGIGGAKTGSFSGSGGSEVMIPIAPATISVLAGSSPTILQDVSTSDNKVSTLSLQVTAAGSGAVSLSMGVRVAASGSIIITHSSLAPYILNGSYPIPAGQTAVFTGIPVVNAVDSVVVYATQSAATAQNATSSGSLA